MRFLMFTLMLAGARIAAAQTAPNIKDFLSCPNSPDGRQPYRPSQLASGNLRKVVINAPNALCNDGSLPVMYVRPARAGAMEPDGASANRWVIHFLGGSSCADYEECGARWCGIGQWEGTLMTTAFDGDFRNVGGLLGTNSLNRLGDRNVVQLKYCSSDQWQGRKSNAVLQSETDPGKAYSLNFQGATIADAAIAALEQGVSGLPKLTAATDVLISGDSAGGTGARTHLDRIAARLNAANPGVRVRGQFEATFGPDFNGKQGSPAGDPTDPVYARKTADFHRIQVGLRNAQLDDSCLSAHPTAPYLCTDDAYLTLNHITTPFFQIQDIQDPLMIDGLLDAGVPATPAQIAQGLHDQLGALTNIRGTAVERAAIDSAPGVVARNCAIHVTYGNDDGFLGRKIRSTAGGTAYSYYDLLWNWMIGVAPSTLLAPRPPATPAVPVPDAVCDAKAPSAMSPSIATGSSASYAFGDPVAPDSIVATFGANLAAATATATTTPWPTTLGGLQVRVTDSKGASRTAPIYYVSPSQVLYLIPGETAAGAAQIDIGSQRTTVEVTPTAPAIYSANATGRGVAAASYIRITAQGVRSEGFLFDPLTKEDTGVPAAPGDQVYLLLYGTGLRGGPATATVGGIPVPVAGPVAQGQYQGLDQINLGPLPLRIGRGQKQIVIRQGENLANIVTVTFRAP